MYVNTTACLVSCFYAFIMHDKLYSDKQSIFCCFILFLADLFISSAIVLSNVSVEKEFEKVDRFCVMNRYILLKN